MKPIGLDANALISSMADMLERTLGETIDLDFSLAADPCPVFVDPSLFENAIINLAVNARDAMPTGGRIEISTAHTVRRSTHHLGERQFVETIVADTGAGMPPEVLARAMEPFFTTKEIGRGTGLGLSQIHGFLAQSGGYIELQSRPGEGTKVHIFLPYHEGALDDEPEGEEDAPQSDMGHAILVVEDEEQVRATTVAALSDLGYVVHSARDGADALQKIEANADIALMITDIVMPGMHGLDLAERAALLRPGLKILFATGYERDVQTSHLEADIIRKPFTLGQLARRLNAEFMGSGGSA